MREAMLLPDGVRFRGGEPSGLGFDAMAAPPELATGWIWSRLTIPSVTCRPVVLDGLRRRDAAPFAAALETAWREAGLARFKAQGARFERLLTALAGWDAPGRYPSASCLAPLVDEARDLDRIVAQLPSGCLGAEGAKRLDPLRALAADPVGFRDRAAARFVEAELARWREFLDTVESLPLTPEQRLAVVVDEDATLVLAGAGSGKTSVITAKAAYLLRSGLRRPDELLLLAFARDAAREMAERVEARAGAGVTVRTFHALAYDILGVVEGAKPPLAPEAGDDMAFLALLADILRQLVAAAGEVARAVAGWFAYFLAEPKTEWDFPTKHAWYAHLEAQDLRTLQGERVRSREELRIANWLYAQGIAYEYEPAYKHPLTGTGRRDYTPDFRLTESGVYIEHFGVRRERRPDGSWHLTTAPFVDREQYLEDMAWKRQVHQEHGTTLIETFSWESQEGRLLDALVEKLTPHVERKPRSPAAIFDRVVEMGQAGSAVQLLGTFLRRYKGGGYTVEACRARAEAMGLGARAQAFLAMFGAVLTEYQRRLGGRIDFEDMIVRATAHVEAERFASPFRHLLVDEFQDISQGRARLLKALLGQAPDAKLFAVGDDWQSIFRFAGSDIQIMRRFGQEFGRPLGDRAGEYRAVDLGRTFRSVDRIALPARAFVLKNPQQIAKEVKPAGEAPGPAIRVVLTRREDAGDRLAEALAALADLARLEGRQASVLLLGRYRKQEPGNLAGFRRRFPGLQITWKTVHASKGLEADHVVILGLDAGGFPSEVADDPLLGLVTPEAETFEHAEERRLMYVAMTRARRTLTLLASAERPSAFVTELRGDPAYGLAQDDRVEATTAQCADCGGRLLASPGPNGRVRHRCEHARLCGHSLPACPTCGTGLPRRDAGGATAICSCGAIHPACPVCADGWLVERRGPHGTFLGCVRFPECMGRATHPRKRPSA